MFEFFDMIVGYIETIVDFIVSTINNLIMVITLIVQGFSSVSLVVAYVPPLIRVVCLALIAYCVIINMLNKGG